jgi:hypothetical protein
MRQAIIVTTLVCAAGCAAPSDPLETVDFGKGQAQAASAQIVYPSSADWGVGIGQVIPNYAFIGQPNSQDASIEGFRQLSLADFYNPTGNETFPAGSPFAGKPKPKALSLGVSATWCPPCNEEAKSVLNPKFEEYKPQGGHFLIALVDGPTPGKPATFNDLTKWTTKYKVPYSMMVDPNHQLEQMFEPALPSNAVVSTKDMTIKFVITGAPIDPKSKPPSCILKATCVGSDPMAKVCSNDAMKTCAADADCGTLKVCQDYADQTKNNFACTQDAQCHVCARNPKEPNCHYWETFESALNGG